MKDMYYDKGTIKLVWIPNDYTQMESIMFQSVSSALNYVNKVGKKDYMLMELVESNNQYYRWKVLPYGSWNSFNYGMKIFKSPVTKVAIVGLAVFGLYKIFKNAV